MFRIRAGLTHCNLSNVGSLSIFGAVPFCHVQVWNSRYEYPLVHSSMTCKIIPLTYLQYRTHSSKSATATPRHCSPSWTQTFSGLEGWLIDSSNKSAHPGGPKHWVDWSIAQKIAYPKRTQTFSILEGWLIDNSTIKLLTQEDPNFLHPGGLIHR